MGFELSDDEGAFLVKLARRAIEEKLKTGKGIKPEHFSENLRKHRGVFVTLNKIINSSHQLRGCIGIPTPFMPLDEAVVESAINAAFEDPRFNPVTLDEMDSIIVEVSVLTPPQVIQADKPEDYSRKIEVGKDGLIVSKGSRKGLLLPQVAVEWGWDAEEFLTQCCLKAWLPPDAWFDKGVEVSKFQAIIFSEEKPRGCVKRVVFQTIS